MKISNIKGAIKDFFRSSQVKKVAAFVFFTLLMTAIIASQNYFFRAKNAHGRRCKKNRTAQKRCYAKSRSCPCAGRRRIY